MNRNQFSLKSVLFVLVILTLVLAACQPTAPAPQEAMGAGDAGTTMEDKDASMSDTASMEDKDAMTEDTTAMAEEQDAMVDDTPTMEDKDAMMDDTPTMEDKDTMTGGADTMMEAPAWFSASLVDVRTGETFSIADLKGKIIVVETFAQWCPNCLSQQNEVLRLQTLLGERDDVVFIALDIDANEDAASLQAYVERHGFTWLYAVAPVEVAREIGNLYGDQFLNPPSAPIFIIDSHGEVHPLPFGIKSAETLKDALMPFLSTDM